MKDWVSNKWSKILAERRSKTDHKRVELSFFEQKELLEDIENLVKQLKEQRTWLN